MQRHPLAETRSFPEPCHLPNLPTPRDHVEDLAGGLSRTMAVAHALLQGGRKLDLTGMNDGVGVLCAQTLDLPLEEARTMLPLLHGVLGRLDQLSMALHVASHPQCASTGASC